MSNAVAPLWSHAQARPDEVALRIDDREWTFGELRDHSARWAARLVDAGLQRGERVLLAAGTRASWVFAYHGILAAGGIAVTVNPASTVPELQYFMADSGARIALSAGDDLPRVVAAGEGLETVVWDLDEPTGSDLAGLDPVDVDPSDGAVIMYTSGTTGKPKGAQLTHHGIGKSAEAVIQVLEMTPEDKVGTALPLFHVFGQVTVMRTAYEIGVPLTLRTKFDAETLLRTAAAYGITILAGVPTMWNAMVNTGPEIDELDLSSLRLACSGGAGLPMRVAEAFEERFDCPILAGYGLTETTGAGACPPVSGERKPESAGVAWPGVELAILDDDRRPLPPGSIGEIAIRCEMNLKDYWNRPDATEAAWHEDWFLTGDLGRMDEDGYLWVVDRIKDLIIRGGYNVYPKEVEEVLYKHPDVLEAAVVGVPDDRLGEEIAAIVVLREGREFDLAAMQAWVAERLAPYKTPRIYHLVDQLPKGSTGKILKREIDRSEITERGLRTKKPRSSVTV